MNDLSVGIWGVLHVIIMIATSKTTGFSFINTPSCEFGSRYEPFLSNMEIDCRTTDPKSNSTLYLKDRPAIVKSSNGSVYLVYITIKSHGKFKCVAQNQQGQKITWECQILPMPYSRIPRPVIDGLSAYPAGYSFNLTCSVTQVGIIKLEFYKITGSGYIKLPNNRLIRNDRSLKLLFITPSVMPKTRYVCKATSRMAAKETDKVISIKNPVQVQIVSFPQGKYLALQPSKRKDIPCRAIGFPRPTLKWFKNGKRILTNMFTCEKGENVKCLAIRSPTYPKDEGNYTCQATNDFSSSRKSIVAAFQFPPKIDDTIKEVVVEGIKSKDLSCKIIKKRGQILPTYFKWLQSLPCISQKQCKAQSKNWQPISANHDQRPPSNTSTFNSTITVPTSALNTRYYKCIASNTLGNDNHVIAFYRSKAYKPEAEIKGVDTFDAEKTIQLSCVISVGNFTRWSKNWRKITQNSRNPRVLISRRTVKDINEIVALTIVNATVDDTGRYRCKGKGYDGSRLSDVKMVTVKAVFKPNITNLSNITVNHYSNNQTNIEITCHVTANPKPLITWRNNEGSTLTSLIKRKNCENTVSGYYLKSTSKETGNVLLICDADDRYTGLYTCHAQNYKGYDVKTAYVDILTSPKIISDSKYKIVNKDIGQSVDKDCNATGNPSPTVMWTKLSPNGTTVLWGGKKETFSKLNIPKLREDDYGNYTCIASNSRGTDRIVVSIRGLAILNKQRGPDIETIILASGIGGVLGLLFLIAVLACCFVNHRQKRLLEEYKAIRYLRSGEDYKLDPNRTILEQCEELPYDADWEFPVKRLILQGVIGSGAFGQVMKAEAVGILSFSARDKTSDAFKRRSRLRRRLSSSRIYQDSAGNDYTRTSVAVKMLKAEANESDYKDLATELKIMIHLGEHSNIINLLGACTRTKQLMVIMEFAPHGNLLNFLRSRREIYEATWRKTANNPDAEFTLADLVMYSYQIARGMDFLSSKKCVHRDLAARNVLIGEDYVMKIADFGLARDIYKSDLYVKETTGLLPVKWMAPESLFDRVYTQKTDVWSFGVVLWETQTLGGTPYPGIPVEELMDYLAEGKRMRQPVDCPPEIYAIMRDCWLHKPSERPTFSELVRRIERIIEKKISGQEAEDAYISVFMDEDLHRIYYLEPKEALKDSSLANSSRNNEPNSMTEEEIQASPLPPVPCLSLENLYKSDGNENDANYCNPIDNNPETRYVQSPLSPKRSPNSKDQGNIFNYYQNSPVSSPPRGTDYNEKRMSESSTGVESGIDMDESYQSNDYSLGRRKRHYGLTQPVYAEGISLLDSSVVKDKTKETFL